VTLHGSPEEIKAAQLGARAMIEQRIGGLRSAARQRTALPEADFNLQKFQILFGMKEATRLAKLLRSVVGCPQWRRAEGRSKPVSEC